VYHTLREMRKRQLAHQVLNLAMIVCSALMIWKSLMVITHSESPVVVVLSGSMEPAFHRGDILFLHMGFTPFRAGDIVVFKVADRDIPIVHRVIKVHEKESGEVDLLTKGDNNAVDDRGLYAASQSWINKEHVIGRAKGYLPYVRFLAPLRRMHAPCSTLRAPSPLPPRRAPAGAAPRRPSISPIISLLRRLAW
jgi:signal peptidase